MPKSIVNIDDLKFEPWGKGAERPGAGVAPEPFAAGIAQVGAAIGARKLGYNITVAPPGKRAFPLHNHRVNEEMFFILEGEGEVRIGAERFAVRKGDFIACPPGGPETAHQIINTSAAQDLRYLAVSTKMSPEIAEYPDSRKFGVYADLGDDAQGKAQIMRHIGRTGDARAYWEGEQG